MKTILLLALGAIFVVAFNVNYANAAVVTKAFKGDLLEGSRKIVLTFDDGPGTYDTLCENYVVERYPDYEVSKSTTENLLNVLDRYGKELSSKGKIEATFFIRGDHFMAREAISKLVLARGHTLGNHSYSHKNSLAYTEEKDFLEEFIRTHELVRKRLNYQMTVLRPPFGVWSDRLTELFANHPQLNLYHPPIMWNIDSFDFLYKHECNVDVIFSNAMGRTYLQQGGVVLFHDIHAVSVAALNQYLSWFAEENRKISQSRYNRGPKWEIIPLHQALKEYQN
ncbi:MAG: polysaccharide deacetylase family protein [Oligoflexia bacterium]|nr:polysaccharide deacetylase family protein [Oligoflexia bacterium]MBF0365685.1 polysaccharide deacetylase family protein [Oligoflexia bacterium]